MEHHRDTKARTQHTSLTHQLPSTNVRLHTTSPGPTQWPRVKPIKILTSNRERNSNKIFKVKEKQKREAKADEMYFV